MKGQFDRDICEASATTLASWVRKGKASPLEVVDAHIACIQSVNPLLNAVVQTQYEEARAEARTMGETLAKPSTDRAKLPPFFGVPFTAKEHLSVRGLPKTGGLVKRRREIQSEDATSVRRMREAGFVLLGTTNVPEGLTWYETVNRVYGRTRNPYDSGRTSGGSSGGEAAIIAAGGSPIGVGGDMGGSIRLPAMMCGIPGHKPTGGRIPETGAWPGAKGQLGRYKVLGPLSRHVEDLGPALSILEGPDGRDLTVDVPPYRPEVIDPKDVRVFVFTDNGIMSPSSDVTRAIEQTEAALRARGARVERWTPPHVKKTFEMWSTALTESGGPKFRDVIGDGEKYRVGLELLKYATGRSDHIFPVVGLAALEWLMGKAPAWRQKTSALRLEMRTAIEEKLGPNGVLLCPVFHRTAPKHGREALFEFPGFTYSAMLNPLELPSTSVPVGFGADGLPVGIQIAAARNRDALTLGLASMVEEDLGGWVAPWRPRSDLPRQRLRSVTNGAAQNLGA